jgi:hypothetical protein
MASALFRKSKLYLFETMKGLRWKNIINKDEEKQEN